MSPVVDAHHHFWRMDPEQTAAGWRSDAHAGIAADFEPADLAPLLAEAGVEGTVLVQSVDSAAENERLAAYVASTPSVLGAVAWLPLLTPGQARTELDRIGGDGWVHGVRCLVGREPLDRLQEPDALAVFRSLAAADLAWDVVPVTSAQTDSVVRVARAVPDLRVVVDHLARPPLDTGAWQPWATHLRDLATCPNVALKVSVGIDVLTAWPAWQPDVLSRYVARAVECFTPERLMLASNWPVVTLRRPYAGAWADLSDAVAACGVDGADLEDVRGGTAVRWYRLRTRAQAVRS